MPKILISKADKYNRRFKIHMSKKLTKDLNDLQKRISHEIAGLKNEVDYKVKYKMDRKSKKFVEGQTFSEKSDDFTLLLIFAILVGFR